MRNKSRHAAPRINQGMRAVPAAITNELIELFNAGQWSQLESRARTAVARYPGYALGWKALGKTLLRLGRFAEAADALSQTINLSPHDADAHNDLGTACYNLGRMTEAEASYRQALKFNPRFAEAYGNLGRILTSLGRFDEARTSLQQSLEINPAAAGSYNNLGSVFNHLGQPNEAIVSFRCALELNPGYFEACINLGTAQNTLHQWDSAQASYRRALEINPNSDIAAQLLGRLLGLFGNHDDEAIACLERSIALNPGNADAYVDLGNILMRIKQNTRAMEMFRRAKALRPLITSPANQEKADFSVVLLDAPFAGSTPVNYLVDKAPYASHFYCVMPEPAQDIDRLQANSDIVINMIADADNGKDILPYVLDLVEQLGRPTVNHPRLIMNTDRETIARTLAGIPLCRIPKVVRLTGVVLAEAAANGGIDGFAMPLLARLAGTHGGDELKKLDNWNAVADFVSQRPEANYYLTEYLDYCSDDGFFRKYRLICIDGKLLPYHLAIHNDWLVHHFRTDMDKQAWMRQEEESFLRDPHLVFDESRQAALLAVGNATGLDYCGIDCALDRHGEVVVFEVNATMLVHDEKSALFAYKNPYISKIRDAFNAMLARLANNERRINARAGRNSR